MRRCLLVIDVQKGFVSDSTGHVLGPIEEVMDGDGWDLRVATRFVNREDGPYVRFMGWRRFMEPPETDLLPFVEKKADLVIDKNVYSAVGPELLEILSENRIDRVDLCGIDTDCCVLKTALDLFENGIPFRVLLGCTASNGGEESHRAAVRVLERAVGTDVLIRRFGTFQIPCGRFPIMVSVRLSDIAEALGAGPSYLWLVEPETGKMFSAKKVGEDEAKGMLPVTTSVEEVEVIQAFLESLDENDVPPEFSWGGDTDEDPEDRFRRAIEGSRIEDGWWDFRERAYLTLAKNWCAEHGLEYHERSPD